ncbi:hypothetical protein EWM64_g3439 [Hericium alpestre]|uniref:Uncharacterized protein n=1 Tax=Hericium alpestre TaxID=135208 RepID=A0A4Z0A2X8_9AGAM|nr:hypothetical protein EWM64_g3439 [Hericium alpestre]
MEEYSILEVEFYLLRGDCHNDPYTHGNEEQRVSGQWYFHRAPRRLGTPSPAPSDSLSTFSGYRGGTRKGLDLTLGTSSSPLSSNTPSTSRFFGPTDTLPSTSTTKSNVRGGVLLRSILRKSDKRVISGPSLLVDELLRVSGASSIVELVKDKWSGDISAFPTASSTALPAKLYLRPIANQGNPSLDSPRIYRSPRIGLDLSNPAVKLSVSDPRIIYVAKPYRYFVHPHLLIANGRGQTFLAIYKSCLENSSTKAAGDKDNLVDEVSSLTGLKTQSVIKYSGDYESGRSSGNIKSFVGPVGKGASASPTTFVKMMGSLERFLARPN